MSDPQLLSALKKKYPGTYDDLTLGNGSQVTATAPAAPEPESSSGPMAPVFGPMAEQFSSGLDTVIEGLSAKKGESALKSGLMAPIRAGQAALGMGQMALTGAAPALRAVENFGMTVAEPFLSGSVQMPNVAAISRNVSRLGNLSGPDRPTTGSPIADTIVEVLVGFLPFERALKLAGLGSKGKILKAVRDESPKSVLAVRDALKVVPEEKIQQAASELKLLPAGPESTLADNAGVMTGQILGQPGGLGPRKIADVTPIEVNRLRPGAPVAGRQPTGLRPQDTAMLSEPMPFQDVARVAARREQQERQFGSVVPQRVFGAQPDPFPVLPRGITGKVQEVERTLDAATPESIKQDLLEISGFRTYQKLDNQFAEEAAKRQSRPAIDTATVEAKAAQHSKHDSALPAQEAALQEQKMPIEISKPQYGMLNRLAKQALPDFDGQDMSYISSRLFGEGRTAPRTIHEFKTAVQFFRDLGQQTGTLDARALALGGDLGPVDPGRMATVGNPSFLRRLYQGIDSRLVSSGHVYLAKQGKPGRQLALTIDQVDSKSGIRAGKAVSELEQVTKRLTPPQLRQVHRALDFGHEAADPAAARAVSVLRQNLDSMWEEFVSLGGEVRHTDGRKLPATLTDGKAYFPHFIKRSYLESKDGYNTALTHLVQTGQAENLGEADRILRSFISRHTVRRFGNMEKAREINLPEQFYETDPVKALKLYFSRGYHRLEEMRHFGRNDEVAIGLVEQIRAEGRDADSAQRIFDSVRGKSNHSEFAENLSGALRSWNVLRSMALSPIINSTQSFQYRFSD
jgi:hypothetical protein